MKQKQFAVLGLGRFGQAVAKTLFQLGHEVLAVDENMDYVEGITDFVTHAVRTDVTDEAALGALGLGNFDCVIVSIAGDLHASLLCVMICRDAGVPCIIAKASDDMHARMLHKIGADRVIFPERDSGVRLARNLAAFNVLDSFELSSDYNIAEIALPHKWAGKTLRQLDLRGKYRINVMALKRDDDVDITPGADDPLRENDMLVVIAGEADLEEIARL